MTNLSDQVSALVAEPPPSLQRSVIFRTTVA